MEQVAEASEPPVVVPVVVVAVDVHVALVIPPVERGEVCTVPSLALPVECSRGCISFGSMRLLQDGTPSSFMS